MNRYKQYVIIFIIQFITEATFAAVSSNIFLNNISYSQNQVDSLISVEVQKQVDTLLIGLKIKDASHEVLETYITEENNHLSFVAIMVTIIGVLIAIVALVVPFFVNRRREKLVDEKMNTFEDNIRQYIKESKYIINKQINEGLQTIDTTISHHANFSVLLIRALTNNNDDIKLHLLEEIIAEYSDTSFVSAAYNCRGNVYFGNKNYDKALVDYTKAIDKDKEFADAYYNRGNTFLRLFNQRLAIEDFTHAIELKSDRVDYYSSRGDAFMQIQDYNNAIADYTMAIGLFPDCADYYISRGLVYMFNGVYDNAIDDYTEAIALNPNDSSLYLNRGFAYFNNDDYDSTIADCTIATDLNPYYAEAFHLRGDAYEKIGKKAKAKADHRKAEDLGYKD